MLRAATIHKYDALSPSGQRNMRLIVIAILSLIFGTCCVAKLSDKRLCYDKDCSVVISTGKTTLPYNPTDPDLISFPGNAEIKVFSKSAGSRQDLWGVEVNGKRGYAPKNFVREYKVLKKDLTHIVPVETATNEAVKNDIPKSEASIASAGDNTASPVQVDESIVQVPKDEASENSPKDTISPEHVTPTFESIYDGTILPQEIDEVEPVTPSYSSPTTSDSANAEEDVQLDLQPNILSSTFSAFSNLFSGDNESEGESEEDTEDVELATSEKSQTEETTTKTPEILEKPDESSPVPGEKSEEVSKDAEPEKTVKILSEETVLETNAEESVEEVKAEENILEPKTEEGIQEVKVEETVPETKSVETTPPEVKDDEIVSEVKSVETTPPEVKDDEIVSEVKIDEAIVGSQPSSPVHPELEELYKEKEVVVEQVANEAKISEEEKQVEAVQIKEDSLNHVPSPEVAVEEDVDVGAQTESVESKNIVEDTLISADNTTEKPLQTVVDDVPGGIKKVVDDKNIIEEAPVSADTTTEKPFQIIVEAGAGGIGKVVKNVPNEPTINVPQNSLLAEPDVVESLSLPEAIPSGQENVVDNNAFNTKNNTSLFVSSEDTILDKQTDNANDTLVNSATDEESIITEVPSKQNTKDESVTPPSESFVPQKPFYQANISSNDGISSEQPLEISENLTAPHEESKPVGGQWTTENQQQIDKTVVDSNNNNVVVDNTGYTASKPTYIQNDSTPEIVDSMIDSSRENIVDIPATPSFGEFLGNRNLLNAGKGFQYDDHSEEIGVDNIVIDESVHSTTVPPASDESIVDELKQEDENISTEKIPVERNVEKIVLPLDTCDIDSDCSGDTLHQYTAEANAVTSARKMTEFNSDTLLIVCITAVTTLLFSLGYYFLENRRRDAFLIAKINKLETNLMKTEKECFEIQEKFTSTKTKLDSIEDESFGSNEMVTSLKAELASSENMREELESQIASLEKELESTSEAGLELERMLREILSSQSEENNPLAQSIEELQTRLNDQQVANESLTAALTAKTQENENLTGDLTVSIKNIEELRSEVTKLATELKFALSTKNSIEETLSSKVELLTLQVKSLTEDKNTLRKQLKLKELEVKELLDVVDKFNSNNLDYEKLYEVSKVKAETAHLLEERDELRTKISDEEGARQLLEEHVRLVTEEVAFLSEQCKVAEKEKVDAKTQLEVLKKFFEEREAQRQKEEKQWLEKQGEHSSVVERLQTMQNEILNYKQRLEMSEREILNQEKEYKSQIAILETKAHEHWVMARQSERRLEESKNESSQLRNLLTMAEKKDATATGDPETKLHRLQAGVASNGETDRTPLFPGGETSTSPLMFVPGGPPPPLPPYHTLFTLHSFLPPPPPPENSRPPPLGGGRLSSPPPHHPSSASNPAASPPPHMFHPFPPSHELIPPPPLPLSSSHNSWVDEPPVPPPNANAFRTHGFQRPRNHKGSLHSSGESLDKSHHSSKV